MNISTKSALRQKLTISARARSFLILAFLSFIWGSSFILIKKSVAIYPSEQVALLRLAISGVAFAPLMLQMWRKIDWSRFHFFVMVGLFGSGIPAFLFAFGQQRISSSVAGILNSLVPLFTLTIGIIIFRAKLVWAKVFGVIVGLIGAAMLILFSSDSGLSGDIGSALLIVLAAMCYGTNSNIVGNVFRDVSSMIISTVSFASVGVPSAIIILLATDFTDILTTHPQGWWGLGYVAILSLVGTVMASIVFFQLIKWTSPVFASMVAYIMPIVSVFWGVIDGEAISWYHFVGMGLILGGVYLSRKN